MLNELTPRMSTLRRVEFSRSLRPNSPRFVLMVEIPDSTVAELTVRKVSLETRAYEVALESTRADGSNRPEHDMRLMSCTKGKIKNLESLGEPNLLTHDACRAWVIKKPAPFQDLVDNKGWQPRPKSPDFKQ